MEVNNTMKNSRKCSIFLGAALFTLCLGCQSVNQPTPSPQSYNVKTSPGNLNIKPQNVVQNIEKSINAPKQLEIIQINAEGIFVDSSKKDWNKVDSRMNLIKTNYNELKPLMQMATSSKDLIKNMGVAIDNLDKQIKAKKVYETRFDSNQLTKYIPDAYGHFKSSVNTDILRMSYHVREIELNADQAQWKSAKTNLDSIERIWPSTKAKINSTYSKDIAALETIFHDTNKSITAKNADMTRNNAKKMLDGIIVIKSNLDKQSI